MCQCGQEAVSESRHFFKKSGLFVKYFPDSLLINQNDKVTSPPISQGFEEVRNVSYGCVLGANLPDTELHIVFHATKDRWG